MIPPPLRAGAVALLLLAGTTPPSAGGPADPAPGEVAARYVPDAACAGCHPDKAASLPSLGMGRAMARPDTADRPEDFAALPWLHAASGRWYDLRRRPDGGLEFRRWIETPAGERRHEIALPVERILGSGNHARVYLYRTADGSLFQLPLAWYAEGGWGVAPGYDRPDHEGVLRRVRRECVFCHTADPGLPPGADRYGEPHVFPQGLPEGIGCQRCHGPGSRHLELARGAEGFAGLRGGIVNPARLPKARRDEVCDQCHLQPSVAVPGMRRFGSGDFDPRPGTPLEAHRLAFFAEEEGREEPRFEINHHAWRLRESACFRASGGSPSCLDCHDPHRKLAPAELTARVDGVCRSCHASLPADASHPAERQGCATCHMPKRRPADVVRTVMTDHRIAVPDPAEEPLAPLAERDPVLVGLQALVLDPSVAPGGVSAEVARTVAALRAGPSPGALERLRRLLAAEPGSDPEPWLELARRELETRRFGAAAEAARRALALAPGHPQGEEWLALAEGEGGDPGAAERRLGALLAAHPDRVEARFNRARYLLALDRPVPAVAELTRTVTARQTFVTGWRLLAEARWALADGEGAEAAARRAVDLEPRDGASWRVLVGIVEGRGRKSEADLLRRDASLATAPPSTQVESTGGER